MGQILSTVLLPLEGLFAVRLRRYRSKPLRDRMAEIGRAFVAGYRASFQEDDPAALAARLAALERETQGFAAEGIGLGLALQDATSRQRRDRFHGFAAGPGSPLIYMLHLGAGWSLALSLPRIREWIGKLDPLYRGMAFDGFGFYRAFFFQRRTLVRRRVPSWLDSSERRSFDVGIGRRLWFLDRGLEEVVTEVRAFPAERQGDLWTGLGEACAFAGGRGAAAADVLLDAAGPCAASFAQGIAFSTEVRERGGNPALHTEASCRTVWGLPAQEVAALTREAAAGPSGEDTPLESWRRRLRERFGVLSGVAGPPAR